MPADEVQRDRLVVPFEIAPWTEVLALSQGSLAELERQARERLFEPHFELASELRRDPSWTFVAHEGGEVLGLFLGRAVADELEVLSMISLRPRQGVGRALLARAHRDAKDQGFLRSLLEVRKSNLPARALYQAFGYRTFRVRKGYYADDDALEMAAPLAPGGVDELGCPIEL